MTKVLVDFPDDLHKDLKRRAIDEGISLKKLIVEIAREHIKQHPPLQPPMFDWLDKKPQNE